MSIPNYSISFVSEVWRNCDPVAVTAGRYYKSEFGLPPKTLHVYEAADADWERGHCKRPALRGWVFDGSTYSELSPVVYPDFSAVPKGMYRDTGIVEFCVDVELSMFSRLVHATREATGAHSRRVRRSAWRQTVAFFRGSVEHDA